jgi:hypothetical protein
MGRKKQLENTKLKSTRFKQLLPKIKKYFDAGYTYKGVIELLATKHDLELTRGTFNTYMTRYYLKNKKDTLETHENALEQRKENLATLPPTDNEKSQQSENTQQNDDEISNEELLRQFFESEKNK